MPSIEVHYFAMFREKAGKSSELLTTEAKTYVELYQALSKDYNFELPAEMIQVAVNDEFTLASEKIQNHSKIVFIPPVAGG